MATMTLARDPFPMRLRRIVDAVTDEATPRLARFVFRNRRDDLPDPLHAWSNDERDEVINPLIVSTNTPIGFPKIIFQTWKSRRDIPANYRYWRRTFIAHNPDYTVLLWDDHDNRRFIAERFPWFLPTYDSYPSEIFRADAVRYFFLYQFGGFYADMDTECLRPITDTVKRGDVILGRMGTNGSFAHSLPNAVMASRPGQIFWLFVIKLMLEAAATQREHLGPEEMTGPVLLKRAYDRFARLDKANGWDAVRPICAKLLPEQKSMSGNGSILLLKPCAWYPLDWTNPMHKLLRNQLLRRRQLLPADIARSLFPQSAVVTYWSHSW